MSRKNSRTIPESDTLQLNDVVDPSDVSAEETSAEEAAENTEITESELLSEEQENPSDEAVSDGTPYSLAEKVLSVITCILSAVLLIGSTAFWIYILTVTLAYPDIIGTERDSRLFGVILAGCTVTTLVCTVVEAVRRKPINLERWMFSMCLAGAVTALITIIYNLASGGSLDLNDILVILCVSVSGSALPAAVFSAIRYLIILLRAHISYENSKDTEVVYNDVIAQCNGDF